MGKKDNNTFYFSGSKKAEDDQMEPEEEDELPDNFIEFDAGKNIPEIIPPIIEPGMDDQDMDFEEDAGRGQWGNKLDFLFSCISVSVGLGNVWRFPYLCYKNGGGAFLIVYFIAMTFCGIPVFFQEVAIGQYLGSGGMTLVAQLCPLFKGVGIATMVLVFFLDIYYCVIIAWTIFYMVDTFDGWWNTEYCYRAVDNMTANDAAIKNHSQTI